MTAIITIGAATAATTAKADTTGKSTASFVVNGNDGALSLDAVPVFNFGQASVTEMLTGTTLDLVNTDANPLVVRDTRGNGNNQWRLTAGLTTGFHSDDSTLDGASVNLNALAGTNSLGSDKYTQAEGATLTSGNDADVTVISSDSALTGTSSYTYNSTSANGKSGATLTIPATAKFAKGTYSGEITWTLTSAQ